MYSLEEPPRGDSKWYIQHIFHNKIRKIPKISLFAFLSYRKNFLGTQKRVRISPGKQAIGHYENMPYLFKYTKNSTTQKMKIFR